MKAKIRGTEIFFDISGLQISPEKNFLIEKPVLFLIHGGPGGSHSHFKFDSLKLHDNAQLVFIDQRGCGFSKKTKKSEYTLQNNIEDIEALRKYLGLKKICVLGISYGGMVAQGYAIRYHKNIEKLILVATAPSFHFMEESQKYLRYFATPKQIAICNQYLWRGKFENDKDVNRYFKTMDPLYMYSKNKKRRAHIVKMRDLTTQKITLSCDALNAGFGGFLHQFNFIPYLNKITCPTLILAGNNDWICRPSQSRIIAKNIKQSHLKIFKNCGHSVTIDANKKYLHAIKTFLNQNGGSSK